MSAHVVIMEEAAFMRREVFEIVIAPLMSVMYTAILAISTPDDSDNYYSVLLTQKDEEGNPLFRVLPVGLACEACQKEGKAAECQHNRDQMPAWKSEKAQKIQKQIMSADAYARENMGLITNKKAYAFRGRDVEETFRQRPLAVKGGVGVVYIMIDPSGGGSGKSNLALVAFVVDEDQNYVVSTDLDA